HPADDEVGPPGGDAATDLVLGAGHERFAAGGAQVRDAVTHLVVAEGNLGHDVVGRVQCQVDARGHDLVVDVVVLIEAHQLDNEVGGFETRLLPAHPEAPSKGFGLVLSTGPAGGDGPNARIAIDAAQ